MPADHLYEEMYLSDTKLLPDIQDAVRPRFPDFVRDFRTWQHRPTRPMPRRVIADGSGTTVTTRSKLVPTSVPAKKDRNHS